MDCYPYIIIIQILYISIPRGHLHVAMNSKFNKAYLLHAASGLTLMYAEISKTMNETMIWPGESGNKITIALPLCLCGQVACGYMPQSTIFIPDLMRRVITHTGIITFER